MEDEIMKYSYLSRYRHFEIYVTQLTLSNLNLYIILVYAFEVEFNLHLIFRGPSWSWSYGSWIYNYMCNQSLSSLKLFEPRSWRGVLDATVCDKVCQLLPTSQWFSPCTLVSSTNKPDQYNWNTVESSVKHHRIKPI